LRDLIHGDIFKTKQGHQKNKSLRNFFLYDAASFQAGVSMQTNLIEETNGPSSEVFRDHADAFVALSLLLNARPA
jgi:hypothetical protein